MTVRLIDDHRIPIQVAEWFDVDWSGAAEDAYLVDGQRWLTRSFYRAKDEDGTTVYVVRVKRQDPTAEIPQRNHRGR